MSVLKTQVFILQTAELGVGNGSGSATSANRPAAVRFPPLLHEAQHRFLPVALPSGRRPSLRCDRRLPGAPRARSGFLPGGVRAPTADAHYGDYAVSP